MPIAKVLLADDDKEYLKLLKPELERAGYQVVTATTPEKARKIIETAEVDLAILDLHLRGGNENDLSGLDVARGISSSIPVIIMTAKPTIEKVVRSLEVASGGQRAAATFIEKDKIEELLAKIQTVLKVRVFVIHGHDDGAKQSVARFLEMLGLTVVILHEQQWAGRTVIENFEKHSNVGFAIALLTPDDLGASMNDKPEALRPRARQNVIFELGFFVAKLGRDKVTVLCKNHPDRGAIEIPSDYLGVRYVDMEPNEAWKVELARNLKGAGIRIDTDGLVSPK